MAGLLQFSQTVRKPSVKPIGRVTIDWTHPLTNSLQHCIIWNDDGYPIELAFPSTVGVRNQPTIVSTIMGPAGYATGGASWEPYSPVNLAAAQPMTVRVMFVPKTWPGAFTSVLEKGISREFFATFDTSGNLSFFGLGGSASADLACSTGFTAGKVGDFAFVRLSASSFVRAFANGVFIKQSSASTYTGTTASGTVIDLGFNTSGGGTNADAQYILFQAWTRSLADDEITQLWNDPFVFINSDGFIGAAPPPPPLFRRTLFGVGTRSTSRQMDSTYP